MEATRFVPGRERHLACKSISKVIGSSSERVRDLSGWWVEDSLLERGVFRALRTQSCMFGWLRHCSASMRNPRRRADRSA